MLPIVVALAATVVLLVWMGFFMMGSLPLLVLKHDTPLDARFIRGLFNVYYVAVTLTAAAAALSYVWSGKFVFALGAALIGALAFALRGWFIIPRMDAARLDSRGECVDPRVPPAAHCGDADQRGAVGDGGLGVDAVGDLIAGRCVRIARPPWAEVLGLWKRAAFWHPRGDPLFRFVFSRSPGDTA